MIIYQFLHQETLIKSPDVKTSSLNPHNKTYYHFALIYPAGFFCDKKREYDNFFTIQSEPALYTPLPSALHSVKYTYCGDPLLYVTFSINIT